jgi:hypothetical protein
MKNQISIEGCTSLRALTLANSSLTSRAILDTIAEIRSADLEYLALWLPNNGNRADDESLPDLAALVETLREVRQLSELRFIYHGPIPKRRILERLQDIFSPSVPSRIIHVVEGR